MKETIHTAAPQADHRGLHYLKTLIVFIFMFGFGHLPPIGAITPVGMQVLGIFIGLLFGWSFLGIIWPSFLGFIALSFSDITTLSGMLAACFGNDLFIFLLLFFCFVSLIESSGLSKFFASWAISRKILRGHPWLFNYVLLLAAYVTSFFAGAFAAMLLLWNIVYSLSAKISCKPYDKYPTVMILGITLASALGGVVLPFKGSSITLVAAFNAMSGITLNFAQFVCFTVPASLFILAVYILTCRFVFRIDVSVLKDHIDETLVSPQDLILTAYQKCLLAFLLLIIALLMLPSILPAHLALTQFLKGLGMSGTMMVVTIALCILQHDHQPLMNFSQAAKAGIQWEALIMIALIIPVASFLTADATGIKLFLTNLLGPLLLAQSRFVFLALILLLAMILTNFANNGIVCIIMMSVLVGMAETLGINAAPIAVALMLYVQVAVATPIASPFAAILFSNKDWVRAGDLYKYGAVSSVIIALTAILFGIFWSGIVF